MGKATFFDLYYDIDNKFSPEARQNAYSAYQAELVSRFKSQKDAAPTITVTEPLETRRKKSAKAFYVNAVQIHDAIKLDFDLLESLIQDTALFNQLPSELQRRVKYYYHDYASLLLDEARIANNRHDVELYQKIFGILSSPVKEKKRPILAVQKEAATTSEGAAKWDESLKALLLPYPETAIFWFGYSNIYRLLARFFTLTWLEIWALGRGKGWFDQSDNLAGIVPIDSTLLKGTTPVFNVLSVFLFFGRFVIDFVMLLKHVFFPTADEEGVNFVERARIEWRKRYQRMVNDVAWTLFNLLTNYAIIFGISAPVASWLLMAFLVFDVYWYGYKWYQAEKTMTSKQTKLMAVQQQSDTNAIMMAKLELRQLECRRAKIRADFIFSLGAAVLLVASIVVLASLSSAPLTAPMGFLACALAVAVYITSDQFSTAVQLTHIAYLNEAKFGLSDLQTKPDYQKKRFQDARQAWKKFAFDFAEALIVPSILIGLYTVSWPAAVALTVAYVAFKIFMSNKNAKAFVSEQVNVLSGKLWSKEIASTDKNAETELSFSGVTCDKRQETEVAQHLSEPLILRD